MDRAVARIRQAIEAEEPIVIYGDYDVDGICATAILYECLSSQGAHVRCKLPTRGGGYGLTRAALENLAAKGFSLVVTVDNGISAVEEAACARELGLDLIVTDHHLPGAALPEAVAVVDPRRSDDASPFKSLCGAGVAFKLCAALEGCAPEELLEMYGELAALGTVADVMPAGGGKTASWWKARWKASPCCRRPCAPACRRCWESGGYAGRPVTADTVSYGPGAAAQCGGPHGQRRRGPSNCCSAGTKTRLRGSPPVWRRSTPSGSRPSRRSLPARLPPAGTGPRPPAGPGAYRRRGGLAPPVSSASWRRA